MLVLPNSPAREERCSTNGARYPTSCSQKKLRCRGCAMMDGLHEEGKVLGTLAGLHNGAVNQELLLHNEYLAAENRILRARLPSRLRLSDPDARQWQKSARGWDARLWPTWLLSRNRIPLSRSTGGSSLRSSTARSTASTRAARESVRKSRPSLSRWHGRIPAGGTTGLPVPWRS